MVKKNVKKFVHDKETKEQAFDMLLEVMAAERKVEAAEKVLEVEKTKLKEARKELKIYMKPLPLFEGEEI